MHSLKPSSAARAVAFLALASGPARADEVDALIAQLRTGEPRARVTAARQLGIPGERRAVEPLIEALGNRLTADIAVAALGNVGPVAIPALATALNGKDRNRSLLAAKALAIVGPPAIETLIAALKGEVHVRQSASYGLEKMGAPAVEPLIAALRNEDAETRSTAAAVLGRRRDGRAAAPLIGVLKEDPNEAVRAAAARALGHLGDRAAVEPLIAALNDRAADVRHDAADALGDLRDERAIEPLIGLLERRESEVRTHAASALGKIGGARAIEALTAALGDENDAVRTSAALALGALRDARATDPLIAALGAAEPRKRAAAAMALGALGDARAVEPLIAALKSKEPEVSIAALRALGKLGGERAERALLAAQADASNDKHVRESAAEALENLRGAQRGLSPVSIKDELGETFLRPAQGDSWQYEVTEGDSRGTGSMEIRAIQPDGVIELKVSGMSGPLRRADTMRWKLSGDFLTWEWEGIVDWRVLKSGSKTGDSWNTPVPEGRVKSGIASRVAAREDVATAAGTFKGCLKIENTVEGTPFFCAMWWAKGVGLVKLERIERGVVAERWALSSSKVGRGRGR